MRVPFVDLAAQQAEIDYEVKAGFADVLARTAFIGGEEVGAFEREYAAAVGAQHCIGLGNGTDAVELALRAVGVTQGGEVILPANTFIATAEAVSRIGALPVPVDVDEEHLLIDPLRVDKAITDKTQAIVPVHLFGQAAPVEAVIEVAEAHSVPVVEDAAQAQGASRLGRPCGSLGKAAATSFYPGKNLGAAGDAGAVTCADPEVAATVRLLANHGSRTKYIHEIIGMNSRLDTLQAVVLRAKLARLPRWNQARRAAAARYSEMLADLSQVQTPVTAEGNEDVWHLYVVRVPDRERVLAELQEAGIGTGIHYPDPIHLTDAYRWLGHGTGSFPVAETAARSILSLPIYPHITVDQQELVVATLSKAVGS